ncbi:MAG: GatB/YqeY domain-containing protein [Candidatus Pacebacteria bacterium]|nr:GatB/YqeY domain-containing protein [Candidatus Paceibacterota bacterium]
MTIKEQIKTDLITAMKAHDEVAKNTLKGLVSAFTNQVISDGGTPQSEVTDDTALNVIKRSIKQRKDAISQFENGGRADLADNEKAELNILEKYLPEQMSEEEILKIAQKKKKELNIEDQSKMGILVGSVMKETAGNADGSVVSQIVKSLFT